ncbi:MAG: hypothetical protein AAGF67_10180 [Verrucomicrobiota bacterium]
MEQTAPITPFPDRLSPVFVRDLRQLLRSPLIVVSFLLLQIAVLGITGIELVLVQISGAASAGPLFSGTLWTFLGAGFGVALPLTAIGALQPELGMGRNIELLLTSSLSRWQVVMGKWLTMTVLSFLLLLSVVPFLLVRYFLGSVELLDIGVLLGSILLTNAVMNAVVVGASGFSSYIARGLMILLFGGLLLSTFSISGASMAMGGTGSRWLWILLVPLTSAVLLLLAMQIGRARLKLFSTLTDPPATGGIFVLSIVFPFALGVGVAAGGAAAMFVVTLLWLALAFMIDRPPRKSYRYPEKESLSPYG